MVISRNSVTQELKVYSRLWLITDCFTIYDRPTFFATSVFQSSSKISPAAITLPIYHNLVLTQKWNFSLKEWKKGTCTDIETQFCVGDFWTPCVILSADVVSYRLWEDPYLNTKIAWTLYVILSADADSLIQDCAQPLADSSGPVIVNLTDTQQSLDLIFGLKVMDFGYSEKLILIKDILCRGNWKRWRIRVNKSILINMDFWRRVTNEMNKY